MPHSATSLSAETIALKGLGFLANSPENMDRFLAASGLLPESLRARVEDPEFLAAVVDFLLADDTLLTGFCQSESIEPKTIHSLRRALPGG